VTAAGGAGPRIEIELTAPLDAIVAEAGREEFERDIAHRVTTVMDRYRIPGRARAVTRLRPGVRAACVFVDRLTMPYPPSFVRRLWFALAPRTLHPLAFGGAAAGYPDAWLTACAEGASAEVRAAIEMLLKSLPEEVVALQPSRTLTGAAAGVQRDDPIMVVGRALVDRGIALPSFDVLTRLIDEHDAAGRSLIDTIEELHARLRAESIELHVNGSVFDGLTRGLTGDRVRIADGATDVNVEQIGAADGLPALRGGAVELQGAGPTINFAAAIGTMRGLRLDGLGVRMPFDLVRSDELSTNELRLKINDRVGPPIPIPGDGDVGLSAPAGALVQAGISALPLVDPVTGHEFAAISAQDAPRAESLGYVVAPQTAYIAAAVGRAISPLAHRLLSVDDIEADVAIVEERFPALVHGALSRFGLTTILYVLRELVSEMVLIDDLWRVLNAMLCYDEMRGPGAARRIEDDPASDVGSRAEALDLDLIAFVRRELADRVTFDTGSLQRVGPVALAAYVTEPEFEEFVAALDPAAHADPEAGLDAIRGRVWPALGASPSAEPVIVTGEAVRATVREALKYELPAARVLARSELPQGMTVQELGRIGLPAPD
jgi:hypothetical protein